MTTVPLHAGWIEVICGGMFSGKTEELIRRLKRAQIGRQKVQCFKPVLDDRYSKDHVTSHDASRIQSLPVARAREILDLVDEKTRVVGVDEAQFFGEDVVDVCQKLANRGIRVVAAGLDMDYRGQPFEPMPRLLAVAEYVTKLSAICLVCGGPASRTQRLVASNDRIAVGSKGMYEARCRFCHDPNEARQAILDLPEPEGAPS